MKPMSETEGAYFPDEPEIDWDSLNSGNDCKKSNGISKHQKKSKCISKQPLIDLNSDDVQKKIIDSIKYGAPCADSKGHSAHLQFRIAPHHVDMMDHIRGMAPRNFWKSQSEYIRSAFTLGSFIIGKYLQSINEIPEIKDFFDIYDMILAIAKRHRHISLKSDAARVLSESSTYEDELQEIISALQSKLEKK